SGSLLNLSASGATQTVTVRFTPTNLTTQSVNVSFTADGDSVSRLVTGTGVRVGSTLMVTKSGAGTGTVTSSSTGINCGTTCAGSYATGTQVTLTATPAAGSTFTGWNGGRRRRLYRHEHLRRDDDRRHDGHRGLRRPVVRPHREHVRHGYRYRDQRADRH